MAKHLHFTDFCANPHNNPKNATPPKIRPPLPQHPKTHLFSENRLLRKLTPISLFSSPSSPLTNFSSFDKVSRNHETGRIKRKNVCHRWFHLFWSKMTIIIFHDGNGHLVLPKTGIITNGCILRRNETSYNFDHLTGFCENPQNMHVSPVYVKTRTTLPFHRIL